MTDKPISPLRHRMVEDTTTRHFAEKVQKDHLRHVRSFAAPSAARPIPPPAKTFVYINCT